MQEIAWDIQIGGYKLQLIESVRTLSSVELLADIATIMLPATAYNKAIELESKLKRGDAVTIKLGYDDKLETEFKGFLNTISSDGGNLKIECEDSIYLYRKQVKDKVFKNADVKQILQYINQQIGGMKLSCDYSFKYDSFAIVNATGYDVLKKIQDETHANIYMRENTLHVHPAYTEIFSTAIYDFAVNIDQDGEKLQYKDASQRKYLVEVESKGKDGKVIKAEAGTMGGDRTTIKVSGITDVASLKRMATEALSKKVYTGYEGSFQSWLVPFVQSGYKATIRDQDYEFKTGTYYVLSVETTVSAANDVRVITLGKKIA